jgi:hypothetical protein
MRESQLIETVHKFLPPLNVLHRQSMTYSSLSHNGTPDRYYDGCAGDLWVEYKKLDSWPRDGLVGGVDEKKAGCYRPAQFAWMARRWKNGGNVWGVIFMPDKRAVIQRTPDEWMAKTTYAGLTVDRRELAREIQLKCLGEVHGT